MISKSNPNIISKTAREPEGQKHLKYLENLATNYHAGKEEQGGRGFYAAADWRRLGSGELIAGTGQVS